jgi:hypothetical protein
LKPGTGARSSRLKARSFPTLTPHFIRNSDLAFTNIPDEKNITGDQKYFPAEEELL